MKKNKLQTEYGIKPHTERLDGYTYVLSYGGGINSTALLIEIVKRKLPLDYVVFADTGMEHPKTYEFLNNHFIQWCIDHNVSLSYVVRRVKGTNYVRETIEQFFMIFGKVPDMYYRDCTSTQKIRPLHKFYKKTLKTKNIIEYIGFHADEERRIKPSKVKHYIRCIPLYEFGINQKKCKEIIESENLPITFIK